MKIGILGIGKMGECIVQGIKKSNHQIGSDLPLFSTIQATTRTRERALEIEKSLGIECGIDNQKLVDDSDLVILCTKPHQAKTVLKEIRFETEAGVKSKGIPKHPKILVSICASISTEQLYDWAEGQISQVSVVRAMPNTPCFIGKGMTVLCRGKHSSEHPLGIAETIFKTLGKTTVIEESLMDAATGLSGCGPAYVYLMIEALSEAGVKVGLARKTATLLAAQTLAGAAQRVLEGDIHPAALKDEVTTPAGCTVDGLMALEEGGLRVTLIKAVLAATRRSEKLRQFE